MRNRLKEKWDSILKNRIYLAAIAAAAAIIICIAGSVCGFAEPSVPERHAYKYYTSIHIKRGDTLWDIANEYMSEEYDRVEDYILEVRRINHLCGDGIYAGEYLTIPRYATESP